MSKPVLAAGLLAVMAGAWHLALLPPVAPAEPARAAERAPASVGDAFPSVALERLRRRVTQAPPAGVARDPFRSGRAAKAPTVAPAAARSAGPPAVASGPAAPTWPRVELIGIAAGEEAGAVVRTAIVSAPQGVEHLRTGDLLLGVYRVERIDGDAVELRLVPEDRVLRLTLRP